jgi:hypothetical protein
VLLVWVGLGILWMVLAARFRSGADLNTTPFTHQPPAPGLANRGTAGPLVGAPHQDGDVPACWAGPVAHRDRWRPRSSSSA